MYDFNEIPEAIYDAISARTDFWVDEPSKESNGFVVKIGAETKHGIEIVHLVDFRNFENSEPATVTAIVKDWQDQIQRICKEWNVDDEVLFRHGGEVTDVILADDLQDYKDNKLGKLLKEIKNVGTIIINSHDKEVDLEAASNIMDGELAEEVNALNFDTDQEWWDEYCKRHAEKYGDEFEPDKLNGQW